MFGKILTTCLVLVSIYNLGYAKQYIITRDKLNEELAVIESDLKQNGAADIIEKYSDSVVLIHTITNGTDDDGLIYNSSAKRRVEKNQYKHGVITGTILSEDGIICTTNSGIMNSNEYIVSINSEFNSHSDNKSISLGKNDYKAKLIKTISELNLAFLKINPKGNELFHSVSFGNDSALINNKNAVLLKGAVVIGKAKGKEFVNVIKPANSENDFTMYATGIRTLYYKKLNGKPTLIADNLVDPGVVYENEGGPVLDMDGKLLGVAYVDNNKVGFESSSVIPVSVVKQAAKIAVPTLLKTPDASKLGIEIDELHEKLKLPKSLKKNLGIPDDEESVGVLVKSVELKSSADDAGIQSGDVIIRFNNDMVTDSKNYKNLEEASIGERVVELKILRKEKIIDIEVSRTV